MFRIRRSSVARFVVFSASIFSFTAFETASERLSRSISASFSSDDEDEASYNTLEEGRVRS